MASHEFHSPNPPETMTEAQLDEAGVTGIDIDPTEDGLEAGIAAAFEAIRNGDGRPADEDGEDSDSDIEDDGVTFALLSELNRLWQQAPA